MNNLGIMDLAETTAVTVNHAEIIIIIIIIIGGPNNEDNSIAL